MNTDKLSGMHYVQANHRFTTNMQRRLYGRATDIHISPLNEEKAIQAAADLLGELFLFMASVIDLNSE
jgi:optic atrophy 3 protein